MKKHGAILSAILICVFAQAQNPIQFDTIRKINYYISPEKVESFFDDGQLAYTGQVSSATILWVSENNPLTDREYVKRCKLDEPYEYDPKKLKGSDTMDWYIRKNELVFIFQKYEILPGIYGTIEIAMPVKKYKSLIKPEALKYFKNP